MIPSVASLTLESEEIFKVQVAGVPFPPTVVQLALSVFVVGVTCQKRIICIAMHHRCYWQVLLDIECNRQSLN